MFVVDHLIAQTNINSQICLTEEPPAKCLRIAMDEEDEFKESSVSVSDDDQDLRKQLEKVRYCMHFNVCVP